MKARTLAEILALKIQKREEYVGEGLLTADSRMVIFSKWGIGKSLLTFDLCYSIATGKPWLGFPTSKVPVMLAQVEIPEEMFQERVAKYVSHNGSYTPDNFHVVTEPYLKIDKPSSYNELRLLIQFYKPKILVIDPLYKIYSGNIADNNQIQMLLDRLDELKAEFKLSLILIGHTRKPRPDVDPDAQDWGQELIGGSFIMNWVDTAIALQEVGENMIRMHFTKTRHAREIIHPFNVRFNRDTLRFTKLL